MIRLGICTSPYDLELVARMGYDYVEANLTWLSERSDEEFEDILAKAKAAPIGVEVCNCMLPGTLKVVGDQVDENAVRAYLEKAFSRAAKLGVKVVVFGSGGARGVPAGYAHADAWRDIAAYLKIVEEYCAKYDIEVAIEPLRRGECNIMNFVTEGTQMSAVLDLPHIGVLGDTYHMDCGHEPLEALVYAGKRLKHIHISHSMGDEGGRDFPYEGDGEDHAALFETLKRAGYPGRVSIEASCKDLEADGIRAFALLNPMR